jgi:murein DD-endopeptidase MepM/ murein hydrolase activator NlpD
MKTFFLALALSCVAACAHAQAPVPARAGAAPGGLDCAGAFAQGGIVVCKAAPGSRVFVDGTDRGLVHAQGYFVTGFDRDAPARATIAVQKNGGERFERAYDIARRQFSIQRVDGLPPQTVNPTDPAVLKKIERDRGLKNRGFASRADATGYLDAFVWPVTGARMSGPWGNQRVLNGEPRPPHYGIDIAAPAGTSIRAPAGGVVSLAHPDLHFEGGLVLLDHGQGLISMYLHMSRLDVKDGQRVSQGQSLGAVGRTGRATGAHLCWRMKWRDRNLDPSLAIKGLADARAYFALGAAPAVGAAPTGFVQWTGAPAPTPATPAPAPPKR